jgi:bacteriocin biosynthesis cyclodehydratase domain-containing protein
MKGGGDAFDHQDRPPRAARFPDHEGRLSPVAAGSRGLTRRDPVRPRLRPTIEVVAAGDGGLYLLRSDAEEDLRVEDTPEARALLGGLDGHRSLPVLAQSLGTGQDELRESVGELWDLGLLEDAAADDALAPAVRERYEGQLRYFSDMAGPGASRVEPQLRLEQARVVVIGVGGLGSWVALSLACTGIGRLELVDGDRVELGNLNRQVLFREADVGRSKVAAAAETLRGFNAALELETHCCAVESAAEIAPLIAGADMVIDAADWPPHLIERWINAACFAEGVPYVAMSQFPPSVRVGPLYVPGRAGCYACTEARLRREYPLFDEIVAERSRHPSGAATFGPACALIGSWVATDVVHWITGICEPPTLGAALELDLRTLTVERRPVVPDPGCAICSR